MFGFNAFADRSLGDAPTTSGGGGGGPQLIFIQTIKDSTGQDLTALGGLDWRHWANISLSSSTRKTSGAGISNLTAIGSITNDQNLGSGRTVTASDPSLSSDDSGVFYGANGTTGWGVSLTVDVGTATRKVYLLIGQFSGAVKVDVSVSDVSSSAISYTYAQSSIYSTDGLLVEFDVAAASAGQTALVEITMSTNIDFGRIGVQAVTLSETAGSTDYPIDSATGSYSVTGASAILLADRVIDSATGSYAITGVDASLVTSRAISADTGTYAITGFDAGLIVDRVISADTGSYAVNGIDATLEYTTVGAYEINAEAGSYLITGSDVALQADRTISADTGSYSVTGVNASLIADRSIDANSGAYVVTGIQAELLYEIAPGGYELNAETGSYSITGVDVTFTIPSTQYTVETGAGAPPQRQKKRPVVVIRDDEEQAQVTIKQIKRLVARRIGKAPIKQEVERQAVELAQIFPIDLTEATELIDNITQQEIIANMRRRQNQDDEQAIKLLLGLE